jgi:hypothetical protein
VIFFYQKADGTKRKAIGTRNVSIITALSSWRPMGNKENTSALCYFDLAKLAWRSMSHGSLIDMAVADFSKEWTNIFRYTVSQSFAARMAIAEAVANGEAGNVPHLADIMARNFVWQPTDNLMLDGFYNAQNKELCEKNEYIDELKAKYNKLVGKYNTLAERHNEVVRENTKNIDILTKIDNLVREEEVNVYPLTRWRPEKV